MVPLPICQRSCGEEARRKGSKEDAESAESAEAGRSRVGMSLVLRERKDGKEHKGGARGVGVFVDQGWRRVNLCLKEKIGTAN